MCGRALARAFCSMLEVVAVASSIDDNFDKNYTIGSFRIYINRARDRHRHDTDVVSCDTICFMIAVRVHRSFSRRFGSF